MPDSLRIIRSSVTLASVLPITAMRCPCRSSRLLILGVGLFLEPLAGSPEGAHRTTTFFRKIATDWASAGMSRSPRATAISVLEAASSATLSTAPSVEIGASRIEFCCRAKVCASN
jgi:hypothetical protein